MMGRQSRQMAMVFVDMASLIPENQRKKRNPAPAVSMFKMLLVGYLYGIKSEAFGRGAIAYRWFCFGYSGWGKPERANEKLYEIVKTCCGLEKPWCRRKFANVSREKVE